MRKPWSLAASLVVQVSALTVVSMFGFFILFLVLMQTKLADRVHMRALADNAESIAELARLIEVSTKEIQLSILSAYTSRARVAFIVSDAAVDAHPHPDFLRAMQRTQSDAAGLYLHDEVRFKTLGIAQLNDQYPSPPYSISGTPIGWAVAAVEIFVPLGTGQTLIVRLAPAVVMRSSTIGIIAVSIVIVCFAIALGFALATVMLGPIRQLERAAGRVELAETGTTIPEKGPLELRRLARVLNKMRVRLGDLIREREQIIAAIAHDIRTGLTRLRLRFDDDDTVSLSVIEGDLNHIETLVTDMLAYSRAESPDGPRELLQLEDFVKSLAESSPFDVSFDLHETISPFEIAADPVALRRLFDNLIENARRYGNGKIGIEMAPIGNGVAISILDNGPGLPPDQLETVFQPFHRMESSRNRNTGGSGLGLGIARAIARAHGASLRLENRAQRGMAAIVTFPDSLRT